MEATVDLPAIAKPKRPLPPGFRQPLPVDWHGIKLAYEQGESFMSLAKRYSIKYDTIYQRARREAWSQANAKASKDSLRPLLSDKLKATAEAFTPPKPGAKLAVVQQAADTIKTLTATAAVIEGWDTGGESRPVTVQVLLQHFEPASMQSPALPGAEPAPATIDLPPATGESSHE